LLESKNETILESLPKNNNWGDEDDNGWDDENMALYGLYRKGITGKLAECAVKKYKSHRCISDYVIEELIK